MTSYNGQYMVLETDQIAITMGQPSDGEFKRDFKGNSVSFKKKRESIKYRKTYQMDVNSFY